MSVLLAHIRRMPLFQACKQRITQPLKEIVVGYQGNMIISCIVIGFFSQVNFRVV